MKNLGKLAVAFVLGMVTCDMMIMSNLDNGEVVHEDDNMYVKASKSRSAGWSFARVNWKKPEQND